MTRYFFDVQDGRSCPDRVGTELPSLEAAQVQAVRTAGEMIRDHSREFWRDPDWRMSVTDEAGTELFALRFTAETPPGASRDS